MWQSSSSSSLFIQYQHFAVSCCGLILLLFLTQFHKSAALVVPNELPSVLSVVYSNVPPIKKGTDSRLGFGFRLGEHADFQVLLELGPQKETRPIGNQDNADGSSFNKRQVNKRQQLKIEKEITSTERSAANWLEKWSNNVNSSPKVRTTKKQQFANKPAEMPLRPQLPDQAMRQLQMLYKMATSSTIESTSTPTPTPTTTESITTSDGISAAAHLQERLKTFKAPRPANIDELQILHQKPVEKTKTEITEELMDVNLDK